MNKIVLLVMLLMVPALAFSQAKQTRFTGMVKMVIQEDERFGLQDLEQESYLPDMVSERQFLLQTQKGLFHLEKSVNWINYANSQVRVSGKLIIDKDGVTRLLVDEEGIVVSGNSYTTQVPPVTQGNFKVLVVGVTIQQPGQIVSDAPFMTDEQALKPVFTDLLASKVFYTEASNGRLNLTGNISPNGDVRHLTITSTITNCDSQRLNQWITASDAQLRQQGIEPNSYNSTIFVFNNPPGCSTTSYGSYGDIGMLNTREFVSVVGSVWLSNSALYVSSHEIGHNLGLEHSSAYRCTDPANIPSSCTSVEYGDQTCIMGNRLAILNSYQRHKLGWHNIPFKQLTFSGNYRVFSSSIPVESAAKRLMSCQFCYIPLTGNLTGYNLYLESRRSYGIFDSYSGIEGLMEYYSKGVKLVIGTGNLIANTSRPYLIDTNPGDTHTYNAPLLLQSYTVGGVQVIHTNPTTITMGSGVTVNMP